MSVKVETINALILNFKQDQDEIKKMGDESVPNTSIEGPHLTSLCSRAALQRSFFHLVVRTQHKLAQTDYRKKHLPDFLPFEPSNKDNRETINNLFASHQTQRTKQPQQLADCLNHCAINPSVS